MAKFWVMDSVQKEIMMDEFNHSDPGGLRQLLNIFLGRKHVI